MSDKRPVCYHEETDEGYRMDVVENSVTVQHGGDNLQNGDLYHCPQCDTYTVATFGEPWTPSNAARRSRAMDVFNLQSELEDFAEE